MKALLLFLLLGITGGVCAQALTYNELINLYNKPVTEITDYIGTKGWAMASAQDTDHVKLIAWGYRLNKGHAVAWIHLTEDAYGLKIAYTFFSPITYDDILKSMLKHKMKPMPETMIKNGISTYYVGDKYVFRIYIQHHETKNQALETLYRVVVIDRDHWQDDTKSN